MTVMCDFEGCPEVAVLVLHVRVPQCDVSGHPSAVGFGELCFVRCGRHTSPFAKGDRSRVAAHGRLMSTFCEWPLAEGLAFFGPAIAKRVHGS